MGHVYGYTLDPVENSTTVTSYYDWSSIDQTWKDADIFPVLSEGALRATFVGTFVAVKQGHPAYSRWR